MPFFSGICEKMETKNFKYWKTILTLYCLVAYIDPRVKVEGIENILDFIATYMNKLFELKGMIYKQLNNLYKYCENKNGNASLIAITSSTFENNIFFMQLDKGKRQVCPSSKCDLSKYLDIDYCSYLSIP